MLDRKSSNAAGFEGAFAAATIAASAFASFSSLLISAELPARLASVTRFSDLRAKLHLMKVLVWTTERTSLPVQSLLTPTEFNQLDFSDVRWRGSRLRS